MARIRWLARGLKNLWKLSEPVAPVLVYVTERVTGAGGEALARQVRWRLGKEQVPGAGRGHPWAVAVTTKRSCVNRYVPGRKGGANKAITGGWAYGLARGATMFNVPKIN